MKEEKKPIKISEMTPREIEILKQIKNQLVRLAQTVKELPILSEANH